MGGSLKKKSAHLWPWLLGPDRDGGQSSPRAQLNIWSEKGTWAALEFEVPLLRHSRPECPPGASAGALDLPPSPSPARARLRSSGIVTPPSVSSDAAGCAFPAGRGAEPTRRSAGLPVFSDSGSRARRVREGGDCRGRRGCCWLATLLVLSGCPSLAAGSRFFRLRPPCGRKLSEAPARPSRRNELPFPPRAPSRQVEPTG